MVAIGFHYSIGGAKTGSGQFIERLNAAGIPVCMKGVGDAGLCFEAQESGKRHGVTNVLAYRVTNDATYQYDTPRYDLPPSEAARLHFDKTAVRWPPELDKSLVWSEPINEPRAKLEPNETTPTWGGMHPVAWLGRFMVEYANIAKASGFKVCGPSFASGDPEVDLWQLEGMADWLRYCADNPDTAALSCHEYNYGSVPYADNCPWHYGRFQAILAAADVLGIPRTFSIIVTEFGWEQYWVPTFEAAVPVLELYGRLCAKFPQVKGIALWTLQDGWGGISDRLAQWISNEGNPFANWVIGNQYPTLDQPQPTAPEFGATLPTQPPDGGGGTMTTYKWKATIHTSRPLPAGATHVRLSQYGADGTHLVSTRVSVNPAAKEFRVVGEEEIEDETENPNPPSVVNPLPQGALVVDVSYANDVNLAELKEHGVQGVIIRASNGIRLTGSSDATGIDIRFWQHLDEAVSLGLEWGSYHYCNENYDDFAQVEHFCGIIQSAINEGYPPPSLGLWLDFETPSDPAYAGAPKEEHRIQALCAALMQLRPVACDIGVYTSKSWWDSKVPNAGTWVPALGIKQWVAAWPAESALVNGWPPATWHPYSLKGFTTVNLWQWTSKGGLLVGHNVASLDLNFVGDTAVVPAVKPPDPPTGATYDTSFMRGEPGIWRVIRRGDGSGEDTWESNIDAQNDVRVKNTNEGEWYFYGLGGVWRKRDTSPAPDPTNGKQRYYVFTEGGQIAPNQAQVGVTYYYPNYVQFREKNIAAGCPNLPANSGPSTSTFLLKEVIKDYVFPGTGFKVDWLYWTVQTGENQLYAIHQGRVLGWVGGGATQANNVWAGELAEVYYDRAIPAQRPLEYC